MGIDVPDLDDRTFEEIVERARRRIPVYTDEWTDHNTHDTGIAVLELLAWISETYSYQIDQITERDREKYLQLLGVDRRPPSSASARVGVDVPAGADGARLPEGERLAVDDQSGEVMTFETTREAVLSEASLERVVTIADDDRLDNTRENETDSTYFDPFGSDPSADDALFLGFDRDPFGRSEFLEIDCDLHESTLPEPASHGDFESTFEPSVDVRWEYCLDYDRWDQPTAWSAIPISRDDTSSFYRSGTVRLREPANWNVTEQEAQGVGMLDEPSDLVWLRCRIETPGFEITPRFDAVRLNVLEVEHRRTVEDELLSRADESLETTVEPNQEFFFDEAPVLDATITIGAKEWTEVDDLDGSGPDHTHYVLDVERGAIRFGDGINGAKPPIGSHVVAQRYVCGGGEDGSVSERAEWQFERAREPLTADVLLGEVDVHPLEPATGGQDAETVEEAFDRFKRDLKVPYRAVTLEDYQYIATHTPGLRFGRATALARSRETPEGDETRDVLVVVVPYSERAEPRPSDGFLDAVREHLYRCRLTTDSIEVRGPAYVSLGIDADVVSAPGHSVAETERAVTQELTDSLHPVTGYGGDGWPFGRPVYREKLADVLETRDAVRAVDRLDVAASGEERIDEYGNVFIPETALPSVRVEDVDVSVSAGGQMGGRR